MLVRRAAGAQPRRLEAEIAVLGSGVSGVSAALEAARAGRRVALVDGASEFGGQAVGAMIGTFCGLYSNARRPVQVTHGIADEILRDLGARGELTEIRGRRNTLIIQYRVNALRRWVEERVREAGILALAGATLVGVRREGRRLQALDLATRFGPVEIVAGGFVDASGDAALAWMAGLGCREPAAGQIFGTVMFTLEGVAEAALADLDRAELFKHLAAKGSAYGLVRADGFLFQAPGSGETVVNMTHVETPLDPVGATASLLDGRAQVDRLVEFLRAEFASVFAGARVRAYGLPGVRQTRTIEGAYQLTAADVREGRRFADAIARCSWPIELHDRAEGVRWEEFGEAHMHYIPFRSLVHAEADNLVAAGRTIDADPVALSSVRVMGPCIAMGAAAAHALDLAGAGSVHQLDLASLKTRLARNLD